MLVDKKGLSIINNLTNQDNIDKKDLYMNNKKKSLKPVDHPNLLNNKNFNDKNKELSNGKIILKSQNKIVNEYEKIVIDKEPYNTTDKIHCPKIIKKTDSNFNKTNLEFSSDNNQMNINQNEINLNQSENNMSISLSNKTLNKFDVNYLKNIDLKDINKHTINESFNSCDNEILKNNFTNNPLMNITDSNYNPLGTNKSSKWNFNKNLLDDSEFRKTHIIKEKLEIENIYIKPIDNINLKKIVNFYNNNNKNFDNSIKIKIQRNEENDNKLLTNIKNNSTIFIEKSENEPFKDLAQQINSYEENDSKEIILLDKKPEESLEEV
jgi:hypothetical protein